MIRYKCTECGKENECQGYHGNSMHIPLPTFCSEECLQKAVEKDKNNANDN